MTRRPVRWFWGVGLLFVLVCGGFLPFLPWPEPGRAIVGGCYGSVFVVGVLLVALPPRSWRDRLFRCDAGIVLLTVGVAEPAVLRWADLAAMSLKVLSGYEGAYVATCELTDRAGSRVAVNSAFGIAAEEITAEAERLLAPRLAPGLIRRYDTAEPLTFGRLTVDQSGLGYAEVEPGTWAWRISWPEIRRVEIQMHGHRIAVHWGTRRVRRVSLDGGPNEFLARYVIEHAAFGHADVTADGPGLPEPEDTPPDDTTEPDDRDTDDRAAPAATPLPRRRTRRAAVIVATATAAVAGIVIGVVSSSGGSPAPPAPTPVPPANPVWTGWPGAPVVRSVTVSQGGTLSGSVIPDLALSFGPGGTSLVDLEGDGLVLKWDLATGEYANLTPPGLPLPGTYDSAAISPDGRMLAETSADGLWLWDLAAGTRVSVMSMDLSGPGARPVVALAFSPDSRWLAFNDMSGNVYLWNVAARTRYQLPAVDGVAAFTFSPDSATLAVGDPDGRVFLLDVATRTVRATLTDRAEERYVAAEGVAGLGMQAVAFGDHGRLLAAATTDYVALWDVATGRLLARLGEAGRQELGQPYALAFRPDGSLLTVAFDDGATDMWAVATGRRVAVAGEGEVGSYVTNIAFSPDGGLLVTSNDRGDITEWHVR